MSVYSQGGGEMVHSGMGTEAIPFWAVPELPPASLAVAWAPREERMGLLRQMLVSLEDATTGGHGYLMAKVLVLFRSEMLDPTARFTAPQLALVNHSLNELEHEAARISPGAVAFRRAGHTLVELFALA